MGIDYGLLPEHCQEGMRLYIERGVRPGSFLTAILENDLVGTFTLAYGVNSERIRDYAFFLWNEAPSPCWGSREKVKAWLESSGTLGKEGIETIEVGDD